MFAARTRWPLQPNRLARLAAERRAAGALLDLTISNPTRCGFRYDAGIPAALASPLALRYEPDAFGLPAARAAVAAYYAQRGIAIAPERLMLTASTSEAYAHLFRLLCDPGDRVLVPAPSYPLLDLLAELHDIRLEPYGMFYDGEWRLDLHSLEQALEQPIRGAPPARALVLIHPNNPTGAYIKPAEWEALQALAARHGLAVLVDEVFHDYPLEGNAPPRLDWARPAALTFALNGLSKIAALPQMKLGWIAACGPDALCAAALGRLEVINDTFLSVDAPVQHAAAALLGTRAEIQRQIRGRVAGNLALLDAALCRCPAVERLRLEAGWSAVLRLPHTQTDERWCEYLLEREGVLTHPGHFYNFSAEAHLVISLLGPPADFQRGAERLLAAVAAAL